MAQETSVIFAGLIKKIKYWSIERGVTQIGEIATNLGDGWNEQRLLKAIHKIENQARRQASKQGQDYEMVFPELQEAIIEAEGKRERLKYKEKTKNRHAQTLLKQRGDNNKTPQRLLFQREGYQVYQVLTTWDTLKQTFPVPERDKENFKFDQFTYLQLAAQDEQTASIELRRNLIEYILHYPNRIALICFNSEQGPKDKFYNLLLDMILTNNKLVNQQDAREIELLIGMLLRSYGPEYAWEFFREINKRFRANGRGTPFVKTNKKFKYAIIAEVTENNMGLSDEEICALIAWGFVFNPPTTKKQVADAKREIRNRNMVFALR